MRHIVSLKVNPALMRLGKPGKLTTEDACGVANAALSTAGPVVNMSVKPLDYEQVIVDRDLLYELRSEVESAWWNCNGGRLTHQSYIDTLVKLGKALGEPCTHTPSGQPLDKDGKAP